MVDNAPIRETREGRGRGEMMSERERKNESYSAATEQMRGGYLSA